MCVERGKVHHAHLDKAEGSDPGPRAHEKVRERKREREREGGERVWKQGVCGVPVSPCGGQSYVTAGF